MKVGKKLAKYRKEYSSKSISIKGKDPIKLFQKWFKEACKKSKGEPNAMALATCSKDKKPSCRMVLLKEYGKEGFSFFTNYGSSKANDILVNKKVSLLFYWPEVERQIKIEGTVKKSPTAISDNYFSSRPRGSQLGAWASRQSRKITSYKSLMDKYTFYEAKFQNKLIPRPKDWGGYIVEPISIEFWQGRRNRLHERVLFTKQKGRWEASMLSP